MAPLDIGLGEHNGNPTIPENISVGDIVGNIKEKYTGQISTAIGAIQARIEDDIDGMEEKMGTLLKSPHIYDAIQDLYPGLIIDNEDLEPIDLLNHALSTPENFKIALEYLAKPLSEFSTGYLGEDLLNEWNIKSLDDVINKIESFPMRLQGNPFLPERYKKIHSGKVRETYQHPDFPDQMILIATDRISTHDVIHMGTIQGKGKALTKMSNFWFKEFARNESTADIPNQLVENPILPDDFPEELRESATVVKKLTALPIEAIVRGYLYGSAEKGYNKETGRLKTGEYIGENRGTCYKFPEPMFTPSTKSDDGDVNVDFDTMVQSLESWLPENGYPEIDARELANQIRDYSIRMYEHANKISEEKGMILGDTKFEFALDKVGKLIAIDEVCTADSSRLWTADSVVEGQEPESHDKQPTRDEVIQYWKNNPDRNGKYYGEKGFQKYSVPLSHEVTDDGELRYIGISDVFSEAA